MHDLLTENFASFEIPVHIYAPHFKKHLTLQLLITTHECHIDLFLFGLGGTSFAIIALQGKRIADLLLINA